MPLFSTELRWKQIERRHFIWFTASSLRQPRVGKVQVDLARAKRGDGHEKEVFFNSDGS
jgi:hypothetical protein